MRRLGCKGTSEAGADGNAAGHRSKPNLCGLKLVGWQKILNMEWNTVQIICWSLKVAKRMRYEAMPHLVDLGKWSASVAQLMCLCLCICICRCLFVDQNEIRSDASSGGSCQVERQCGSANVCFLVPAGAGRRRRGGTRLCLSHRHLLWGAAPRP